MGSGDQLAGTASPRILMGWRLVRANLGKLLGLSATGSSLLFLWMLMQPAQYRSSALLEVAQAQQDTRSIAAGAVHIIQSRSVIEQASSALALQNLASDPTLLRAGLQIHPAAPSLLRVLFDAPTPQLAQQTVDAVVRAYITFNETQQIAAMEGSADLLLRKLDKLFDVGPLWYEQNGSAFEPALGQLQLQGGQVQLQPVQNSASAAQLPGAIGPMIEEAVVRSAVADYEAGLKRVTRIAVIDPANLPVEALPKIAMPPLLLSYVAAFGLLLVAGLWLQRRRNTVALQDEVQALFDLPVFSLPDAEGPEADGKGPLEDPAFAEALRTIRMRLCTAVKTDDEMLALHPKARTVLVTSATAGEGKSSVAEGLALSLGQIRRVLLVNSDLRSRDRSFCRLPADAPGLSHLIAGAAQVRDCIHVLKDEGIDVIPAGVLPPNPQELLASSRFPRLLDMLQRRYDFIIVAAPSLDVAADTLLLSQHCSDSLLVMSAGRTSVSTVQVALQQLSSVVGPQPSIVLNRVDFSLARRYGFDSTLPADAGAYAYSKPGGSFLAAR